MPFRAKTLIPNTKKSDLKGGRMKPFTTIAVIVFILLCLAHVLRLIFGMEVRIGSYDIPQWISIVGILFAGLMAIMVWKESK